MKITKRHISFEHKLILGIVVAILAILLSLFIHNKFLVGHIFTDNVILSIVGVVVIFTIIVGVLSLTFLFGILIGEILFKPFARRSFLKSKEKIKELPNEFVDVHLKISNNFPLEDFVTSEDVTCFAKLNERGKVVCEIHINAEYETDDYEVFLSHFDI